MAARIVPLAVFVCLVLITSAAIALPTASPVPKAILAPGQVAPGGRLDLFGSGYLADEPVTILVRTPEGREIRVGSRAADLDGQVGLGLLTGRQSSVGSHLVVLHGERSGRESQAMVLVGVSDIEPSPTNSNSDWRLEGEEVRCSTCRFVHGQ
jgi:hypothetical protein